MILHLTRKVQNVNKIKVVAQPQTESNCYFNNWYVDIFSTGFKGKSALVFMHDMSRLPISIPGKSLQKAIPPFLEQLKLHLLNWGISNEEIENELTAANKIVYAPTSNKSILGSINNIKLNAEYSLTYNYTDYGSIDWAKINLHMSVHLFSVKGKGHFWSDKIIREHYGLLEKPKKWG